MKHRRFLVTAEWDEEARVWVATSDDLPGLVTEADSLDVLVQRIVQISPELFEDNRHLIEGDTSDHPSVEVCVLHQLDLSGARAN